MELEDQRIHYTHLLSGVSSIINTVCTTIPAISRLTIRTAKETSRIGKLSHLCLLDAVLCLACRFSSPTPKFGASENRHGARQTIASPPLKNCVNKNLDE